jgi:elongation factor 1-alpha
VSFPRINLVVIGHKDHGKSTLIGRLLYDSKAIPAQKLQEIKEEIEESGKEFEFAFLLDSLEEERKGGLSIDIIQTPFKSQRYFYTIIDCPGHKEFIKKMLTGASQADAAVLVISAKEGIQDQTREHAFLIKTLGIHQLVVAVNKLDEMAYKQSNYDAVCRKIEPILASLGYTKTLKIPISAMKGDNVFTQSQNMAWYDGSSLIDTLDNSIRPSALPVNKPLRGLVQDTYQQEGETIIVCKIATGMLEAGRKIAFSPSGIERQLETIDVLGGEAKKVGPGDSVGLHVKGAEEVERGEVVSYPENKPREVKSFIAEVILFSNTKIRTGDTVSIRYGTAEKRCEVKRILKDIDPVNLTVRREFPKHLQEGSVGEIEFSALQPVCVETYSELPQLGRFVIEGTRGASAAGIVLEVR